MFDQPVLDRLFAPREPCRPRPRRAAAANRYLSLVIALPALAGCGTTSHFVEQPRLTIDRSQEGARQAVAQLFTSDAPYTVKLCEADPSSQQCKKDSESISATGVGGLFIPLVLHVHGIGISEEHPSADGLAMNMAFESTADGIPPICARADGKVILRDNDTALLQAGNFYCNWMAVGNVLVNVDLSINSVDLRKKTFTGYYRLVFHGTGNVSGSGYYRATIKSDTTTSAPRADGNTQLSLLTASSRSVAETRLSPLAQ
jgi:hypothetical protein